jgi:hypothetical protein
VQLDRFYWGKNKFNLSYKYWVIFI